jgi:hypothetical protein
MEAQRKARASLVDERNRETGTLAALKAERAFLAVKRKPRPSTTWRNCSAPTPTASAQSGGLSL